MSGVVYHLHGETGSSAVVQLARKIADAKFTLSDLRGFIRSRLPAVYRRLCCHQFASHRRLLWPDFQSNPYSDRRLLRLTQPPTPKVIETPGICHLPFTKKKTNLPKKHDFDRIVISRWQ